MTKYIVNDKEVEYLHIEEKADGTTIVTFEEKFNLVTAHMGVIMRKLRDEDIQAQVFKDFKHDIISIWINDLNDVYPILHTLNIPPNAWELCDDMIICVDIPLLETESIVSEVVTKVEGESV